MKVAGEERPDIKQRIQFFSYRTREELYDLEKDPDALNNLIGNPEYADMAAEMKGELIQWMEENEDPEVEKIR